MDFRHITLDELDSEGRELELTAEQAILLRESKLVDVRTLGGDRHWLLPNGRVGAVRFDDLQVIGARYLRDNIKYELGDAELEGLTCFFRYAAELELVRAHGELRFF